MGPLPTESKGLAITAVERIRSVAGKAFEKPMHFLYYLDILIAMIGTSFNVKFSKEFWVILLMLAVIRLFDYSIQFIASLKNGKQRAE